MCGGQDTKAKVCLPRWGLIFNVFLFYRKQLPEKAIEFNELIISSLDLAYPERSLEAVDEIYILIKMSFPAESIMQIANTSKQASASSRKSSETILQYIARFVSDSHLTLRDKPSLFLHRCRKRAMNLLTNSNLSSKSFSSVTAALV